MSARLEKEVAEFAKAMTAKLNEPKNAAKGDSWKRESISRLCRRLAVESQELHREIYDRDSFLRQLTPNRLRAIQSEALDVANFAMFIYHVAKDEGGS